MNILLFSDDDWGQPLALDDYRLRHIHQHLKLHRGDYVRVGLIDHGTGMARLLSEPGSGVALNLSFPDQLQNTSFPLVSLIIGQPRPTVFKRMLRDLTTMGVGRISWVNTDLGEKSYFESRAWQSETLERQLRLGLEQGAHCTLPFIERFYTLRRCLSMGGFISKANQDHEVADAHNQLRILLSPPQAEGLTETLPFNEILDRALKNWRETYPSTGMKLGTRGQLTGERGGISACIAVGPERGWTASELEALFTAGFIPANLGKAILRTETAATLAAGMILLHIGNHT